MIKTALDRSYCAVAPQTVRGAPCASRLLDTVPGVDQAMDVRTFFVTQDREKSTDSVQGAAAQESIDSVEGEGSTVSVEQPTTHSVPSSSRHSDSTLSVVSVPNPKLTPARIAFSIARVILEAIYAPDEVWGTRLL